MGAVYQAEDSKLNVQVALKFRLQDEDSSAEEEERYREAFIAEARRARTVTHHNVVRVYDVHEDSGVDFIAMEFIEGQTLEDLLQLESRLSLERVRNIGHEISLGLAAIHEAGLFHQDLKPGNVMVNGEGKTKITDLGLAGKFCMGWTPAYAAPEQLRKPHVVSAQSDIYSLGVILVELLTGSWPDQGDDFRLLVESDEDLESFIRSCLEEDPDLRPPSAMAAAAALRPESRFSATRRTLRRLLVEPTRPSSWTWRGIAITTLASATIATAVLLAVRLPLKEPAELPLVLSGPKKGPPPGFVSQPTYEEDCRERPAGTICLQFSDGYIWLIEETPLGPVFSSGKWLDKEIEVRYGSRHYFYHVKGTSFIRKEAIFQQAELTLEPAGSPCSMESGPSQGKAYLTVFNSLDSPVALTWKTYSGEEQLYKLIEPGEEHRQASFVQHAWCLRDTSDGTVVSSIRVDEDNEYIFLQ